MNAPFLTPAEAASRLGVSAKALRLYEQRGLIVPDRTSAGWRVYGTAQMARAQEIVALRRLGLSLVQIELALGGDQQGLTHALATHQAALEGELQHMVGAIDRLRSLRADLAAGRPASATDLAGLLRPHAQFRVEFDLPWPWGGETFTMDSIKPITYITGPLGSGKTRFAKRLAEALPGGRFIGLDRLETDSDATHSQMQDDDALRLRVEQARQWLVEDGGTPSSALDGLLVALLAAKDTILVIDMVEDGLEQATQAALIAYLRNRGGIQSPLFLMTRSSSILDLGALGLDEGIIFCPANHSPPIQVLPIPGSPGHEAVATCLASPDVRARTAGMVAVLPQTA